MNKLVFPTLNDLRKSLIILNIYFDGITYNKFEELVGN